MNLSFVMYTFFLHRNHWSNTFLEKKKTELGRRDTKEEKKREKKKNGPKLINGWHFTVIMLCAAPFPTIGVN